MISIEMQGVDEVLKNLREFPRAMQNKALRPALRKGAAILQKAVVAIAPVESAQPLKKSDIRISAQTAKLFPKFAAKRNAQLRNHVGLLKRSLTVRAMKRSRSRLGYFVGFKNVAELTLHSKGANKPQFYPAAVEYGHKIRGDAIRIVRPHPYMRPAFDSTRAAANQAVVGALQSFVSTYRPGSVAPAGGGQ